MNRRDIAFVDGQFAKYKPRLDGAEAAVAKSLVALDTSVRTEDGKKLIVQIRRELSVNKLLNKEITSHINISDSDVAEFYNANKASFNLAEPQIHLLQIVVTPAPDPSVLTPSRSRGSTSSPATSMSSGSSPAARAASTRSSPSATHRPARSR